jgi:hypothetical protein
MAASRDGQVAPRLPLYPTDRASAMLSGFSERIAQAVEAVEAPRCGNSGAPRGSF